jgi:flagellar biosynthesis/type III secretory pathway ATPase
MKVDLDAAMAAVERAAPVRATGRVVELTGLVVRATAPGARAGELCLIDVPGEPALAAEVVGFRGGEAVLLPLGEVRGLGPQSAVAPTGAPLAIRCGESLLGRVPQVDDDGDFDQSGVSEELDITVSNPLVAVSSSSPPRCSGPPWPRPATWCRA